MKLLIVLLLLMSCTRDSELYPFIKTSARCGWVSHKYYQNPPMDTTLANRTYWLQVSFDTTCPPGNPNCGRYYNIQVPKSCWDTMLPPGSAATRYCE